MTSSAVLQRLTERLDRVEAENERLRALIEPQAVVGDEAFDDDQESAPQVTSRRTWLARGAAVAVGAFAGATMAPRTASAIGEVFLNVTNTGSTTTRIDAPVNADVLSSVFYALNTASIGAGLHGYGNSFGVLGFSDTGTGVFGKASGDVSHAAVAVSGFIDNANSQGSTAIRGQALGVGQIAIKGESDHGWAGWFSSGFAELTLGMPNRTAPTGDAVYHAYGDVVAQTGGNRATLWLCIASGTPGTWRRLGGDGSAGALSLLPAPIRVYDTRPGAPPSVGPKTTLAPDVDRLVDCTLNSSGVPADATGVLLNVTVVAGGTGYLSVRAKGVTYTGTSSLNFVTGQVVPNSVTSACGPGATIAIRLAEAPWCHVIVDVIGYYR